MSHALACETFEVSCVAPRRSFPAQHLLRRLDASCHAARECGILCLWQSISPRRPLRVGSASLTTNASGNPTSQLRYLPYGAPRTGYPTGSVPTDLRFTGQRSEEASLGSLYDYGARFYSPVLGRFLSADTLVPSPGNPQSLNRYSYVLGNPLKYTDPSGHWSCSDAYDPGCAENAEELAAYYQATGQWSVLWSEHPSPPTGPVYWYKDNLLGGTLVRKYKDAIVQVEQERGIPSGYLGAIVWHEGSSVHQIPDAVAARLGRDTTIGIVQMLPSTAQFLEQEGYISTSKNRDERVKRLLDPQQGVEYAGAYLEYLYDWVSQRSPQGTPEQAKWDLAVVGYNVGTGALEQYPGVYGFGRLGPSGQTYYNHVVPHIARIARWLYPD